MKLLSIVLILLLALCCESINIRVKNFWINKCGKSPQHVELYNIKVKTDGAGNLKLSGTLTTDVDLESPISVFLDIKKRVIGLWIKVPCIKNIGSCTYYDVCRYGVSKSNSCPSVFDQHNVPCRCPISKGTYTIPPTTADIASTRSIATGNYIGRIYISHKGKSLGCFNTKFSLI